jgi:hypothetical protein
MCKVLHNPIFSWNVLEMLGEGTPLPQYGSPSVWVDAADLQIHIGLQDQIVAKAQTGHLRSTWI